MAARTGICQSAHSIRAIPSGASARSLTSCRFVVAIDPLSGGQQPFVFSLFPLEVGRSRAARTREPGLDRRAQVGLGAEPRREGDVGELHAEARAELA